MFLGLSRAKISDLEESLKQMNLTANQKADEWAKLENLRTDLFQESQGALNEKTKECSQLAAKVIRNTC